MSKNQKLSPEEIIAVQDIILEYILSNGWKDYKAFARTLSEKILRSKPLSKEIVEHILSKIVHPFFSFNNVPRKQFVERFPIGEMIYRISEIPVTRTKLEVLSLIQPADKKSNITLYEIFPEIQKVDIETGKQIVNSLDIYERIIQNALRDVLREKKATNIFERKSDSSLEVADIEDFTLRIRGKAYSFSAVVKGHKSVGKKATIVFEDIAHQVLKANDTHPDHILLILAKPLGDSVVSNLVKYGEDCGNRNLVITMDPIDLARFLRVRCII